MTNFDKRAFFIIPFGKRDIEKVWSEVYVPVANSAGFEAVRIDERDDGKIKIDQIVNELSTADLIIGDVTYERPNCYFEIGFARARREHDEVILCARSDHLGHSAYRPKWLTFEKPHSVSISFFPRYVPPKVHFDLAAFDILPWSLCKLDDFKRKLENRLQGRLKYIEQRKAVPTSVATKTKPSPISTGVDLNQIAEEMRKQWDLEQK